VNFAREEKLRVELVSNRNRRGGAARDARDEGKSKGVILRRPRKFVASRSGGEGEERKQARKFTGNMNKLPGEE